MEEKLLVELAAQLVAAWVDKQTDCSPDMLASAYSKTFDVVLEKFRQEVALKQEMGLVFPLVHEVALDELGEDSEGIYPDLLRFAVDEDDDDDDEEDEGSGGLYQ